MLKNISSLRNLVVESKPLFHPSLSFLSKIDWVEELRLILTAALLGSIILILEHRIFASRPYRLLAKWITNHLVMPLSPSRSRAGPIRRRPTNPNNPTRRTVFTNTSVAIYAWPSRGGVIILEKATHVNFVFLGLSTTDPPLKRDHGDKSGDKHYVDLLAMREDAFCQRLLLLGAKWWDSEARYRFVIRVDAGDERAIEEVEEGRVEEDTLRERRLVRVGWEGTTAVATALSISGDGYVGGIGGGCDDGNGSGGLWVLDCDTNMHGILEEEHLVPDDAGKVYLARSMEERCQISKRTGATFFGRLEKYEGRATYLRVWEWKWEG